MQNNDTERQGEWAEVKVNFKEEPVLIKASSKDKPQVLPELQIKWQQMIDIAAKLVHVPAALIRKLHTDHFETIIASNTPDNPIPAGEISPLKIGAYCPDPPSKK